MKIFRKYASLVLFSAVLVATVPTYTMETEEVVNSVERLENADSEQVVWYKKPEVKYGVAVVVGFAALCAGVYWYKNLISIASMNSEKSSTSKGLSGWRLVNSTHGSNTISNSWVKGSVVQDGVITKVSGDIIPLDDAIVLFT